MYESQWNRRSSSTMVVWYVYLRRARRSPHAYKQRAGIRKRRDSGDVRARAKNNRPPVLGPKCLPDPNEFSFQPPTLEALQCDISEFALLESITR